MKKKLRGSEGYRIRVGYVSHFGVQDVATRAIVGAYDSLSAALAAFPGAEVDESSRRKAEELGEK